MAENTNPEEQNQQTVDQSRRSDGGRQPVRGGNTGGGNANQPQPDEGARMSAEEREKQLARARGVDDDTLEGLEENTTWIISNRTDDRSVLWERDARHPGGEVHIGPFPTRAYLTPGVQEKLFRLEAIRVPEPMRTVKTRDEETGEEIEVPNRKYPPEPGPDPAIVVAAQPGRPIPIGRKLDPELWDENARKQHQQTLRGMPPELPVPQGVVVGGQ